MSSEDLESLTHLQLRERLLTYAVDVPTSLPKGFMIKKLMKEIEKAMKEGGPPSAPPPAPSGGRRSTSAARNSVAPLPTPPPAKQRKSMESSVVAPAPAADVATTPARRGRMSLGVEAPRAQVATSPARTPPRAPTPSRSTRRSAGASAPGPGRPTSQMTEYRRKLDFAARNNQQEDEGEEEEEPSLEHEEEEEEEQPQPTRRKIPAARMHTASKPYQRPSPSPFEKKVPEESFSLSSVPAVPVSPSRNRSWVNPIVQRSSPSAFRLSSDNDNNSGFGSIGTANQRSNTLHSTTMPVTRNFNTSDSFNSSSSQESSMVLESAKTVPSLLAEAKFGLIANGRMLQTDCIPNQAVSPTKFIFNIKEADSVQFISIFLTGNETFPPGTGGQIFFGWPDERNSIHWSELGYISNQRPSSMFDISDLKQASPSRQQGQSAFNMNSSFSRMSSRRGPLSGGLSGPTTAQIGISIEPIEIVLGTMRPHQLV